MSRPPYRGNPRHGGHSQGVTVLPGVVRPMTHERRARLVRIVVEFLLAEMEREAAERASVSRVAGTVSGQRQRREDVR